MRIVLRSITYTVRWNNIEDSESISWRAAEEGSRIFKYSIAPGLYNVTYFRNLVRRLGVNILLSADRHKGLILLILPREWLAKFTDGLLNLMELDDGLNGQWLETGTYNGDRLVDFTGTRTLHVHLDQINTAENRLNGAPTTILFLFQLLVEEQASSCLHVLVILTLCDLSILNELKITVKTSSYAT